MGKNDDSGLIGERRGTNGFVRVPDGDQGWQPQGGVPGKRTAVPEGRPVDPVTGFLRRLDAIGSALDGIATRHLPAMREAIAARAMHDARRTGGDLAAALRRLDSDLHAMQQQALLMENAAALAMLAPLESRRDACRVDAAPLLALVPPPAPALSLDAAFAPHLCLDELAKHDAAEAENRVVWSAEIDASEVRASEAAGSEETTASSTSATNVIDAGDRFRRNDEVPAADARTEPVEVAPSASVVQRRARDADHRDNPQLVHQAAMAGIAGSGRTLPHADAIQRSFGAHDVFGISAHVGGAATEAAAAMGAEAYATGNHVAFASSPSLHTAAHEAAHVVQQRAGVSLLGGVGRAGDSHEQHADAVAERVVRGESAEELLGTGGGMASGATVQRQEARATGVLTAEPASIQISAEVGKPKATTVMIENRAFGPAQVTGVACGVEGVVVAMAGDAGPMSGGVTIAGMSAGKLNVRYTPQAALDVSSTVAVSSSMGRLAIPISAHSYELHRARPLSAEEEAAEAAKWNPPRETPKPYEVSPEALAGIHLYLTFKSSLQGADLPFTMRPVGVIPGDAGPYEFVPRFQGRLLAYYLARHRERQQFEWVIGPREVAEFTASVGLYVGAARVALPGSIKVAGSQADGTAKAPHLPSFLEQEAFGTASYQNRDGQSDGGSVDLRGLEEANGGREIPSAWAVARDVAVNGLDDANGSGSLMSAGNAHIRLQDYVAPAEQMARDLKRRVDAGEIGHLEGRDAAVNGRNSLMRQVRGSLSPSAGYASEKSKADEGRTVADMKKKKTEDLLRGATESSEHKVDVRAALMTDSSDWVRYIEAMEAPGATPLAQQSATDQALQELGSRPVVSRAIIESSGHSNPWVTRLAKVGRTGSATLGAIGVIDAIDTVLDADEGKRAHVAAHEMSGFAGGAIGFEVGSATAVWMASAISAGPGAPVILIVSLIGGMVGAAVGAEAGPPTFQVFADAATTAVGVANPMHMSMAGGGFTGMNERAQHDARYEFGITRTIEDLLHATDDELHEIEESIADAPDRGTMERHQRERLALLAKRNQLGDLLLALRTGAIDEVTLARVLSPQQETTAKQREVAAMPEHFYDYDLRGADAGGE